MAYFSFPLLLLLAFTSLLSLRTLAQTPSAPPPSTTTGPLNLTGILDKNQQFITFIRFLISTQIATQIQNQINSSADGMTVFAPTDNAFLNLKSGALNSLTEQQQVQLILYHVVPKFYSLTQLLTVPNPVRTQASGRDNGVWGLNFTGTGQQVNISTGVVNTMINSTLYKDFPLAVYIVDKVLLPYELFGDKPLASSPPPSSSEAPSPSNSIYAETSKNDSPGSRVNLGFAYVLGFGLIWMGTGLFCEMVVAWGALLFEFI